MLVKVGLISFLPFVLRAPLWLAACHWVIAALLVVAATVPGKKS